MEYIQFSKLRANCREIFDRAKQGENFLVLRHGNPIAKIIPYNKNVEKSWKRKINRVEIKGKNISETVLEERYEI